MSARLRLHGVSSYGRSRRPKPCGRDDFPLGAKAPIPRAAKLSPTSGPSLRFGLAPFGASVRASPSRPSRTAIATGAAAPTMESKMKTFAEFQILGRIGKVREVGQTTRVSICANYASKTATARQRTSRIGTKSRSGARAPANMSATMRSPATSLWRAGR